MVKSSQLPNGMRVYYCLALPSLHENIAWKVGNLFKSTAIVSWPSVHQIGSFLKVLNQVPGTSIDSLRGCGIPVWDSSVDLKCFRCFHTSLLLTRSHREGRLVLHQKSILAVENDQGSERQRLFISFQAQLLGLLVGTSSFRLLANRKKLWDY